MVFFYPKWDLVLETNSKFAPEKGWDWKFGSFNLLGGFKGSMA